MDCEDRTKKTRLVLAYSLSEVFPAGREQGAALLATALVDQMFGALMAKGRGGWNHSALFTLIGEWSELGSP
jgi:3-hydroxyisobutyrate dehydrogenase-like beta-hydroxyacid dehydrogenase